MIKEKGSIHFISEVKSGTTKNGTSWANCTLVLEVPTSQNSFKYVALKVQTNDVENVTSHKVGDKVEVGYICSSREWNGNWYTDAILCSIMNPQPAQQQTAPAPEPQDNPEDDLPFDK